MGKWRDRATKGDKKKQANERIVTLPGLTQFRHLPAPCQGLIHMVFALAYSGTGYRGLQLQLDDGATRHPSMPCDSNSDADAFHCGASLYPTTALHPALGATIEGELLLALARTGYLHHTADFSCRGQRLIRSGGTPGEGLAVANNSDSDERPGPEGNDEAPIFVDSWRLPLPADPPPLHPKSILVRREVAGGDGGASLFRTLNPLASFRLQRSCRTDKGVHAVFNTVSLFLRQADYDDDMRHQGNDTVVDHVLMDKLNKHLPPSVRVLSACPALPAFEPRYCCTKRTYRYLIPLYAVLGRHQADAGDGCDSRTEPHSRSYDWPSLFQLYPDLKAQCQMDHQTLEWLPNGGSLLCGPARLLADKLARLMTCSADAELGLVGWRRELYDVIRAGNAFLSDMFVGTNHRYHNFSTDDLSGLNDGTSPKPRDKPFFYVPSSISSLGYVLENSVPRGEGGAAGHKKAGSVRYGVPGCHYHYLASNSRKVVKGDSNEACRCINRCELAPALVWLFPTEAAAKEVIQGHAFIQGLCQRRWRNHHALYSDGCPVRFPFLVFQVEGQSFLLHMIRKMVGVLLAFLRHGPLGAASDGLTGADPKTLLDQRTAKLLLDPLYRALTPLAPGSYLSLVHSQYGNSRGTGGYDTIVGEVQEYFRQRQEKHDARVQKRLCQTSEEPHPMTLPYYAKHCAPLRRVFAEQGTRQAAEDYYWGHIAQTISWLDVGLLPGDVDALVAIRGDASTTLDELTDHLPDGRSRSRTVASFLETEGCLTGEAAGGPDVPLSAVPMGSTDPCYPLTDMTAFLRLLDYHNWNVRPVSHKRPREVQDGEGQREERKETKTERRQRWKEEDLADDRAALEHWCETAAIDAGSGGAELSHDGWLYWRPEGCPPDAPQDMWWRAQIYLFNERRQRRRSYQLDKKES